jgi:DNA-binding transcriptional MerR regulator
MKKLSIGKVSHMVDLPQSVLRYWETVFDQLNPEKSEGGTRRYSMEDLNLIIEIKNLLYNKKFTIAGARATLSNASPTDQSPIQDKHHLEEIISEIDDIINELNENW